MLIRPAIGNTDPARCHAPSPDGQLSGNILSRGHTPVNVRRRLTHGRPEAFACRSSPRSPSGSRSLRRTYCASSSRIGGAPRIRTCRPSTDMPRAAATAPAIIEPLSEQLSGYFYVFGVSCWLLKELGRADEVCVAFDQPIAQANLAAEFRQTARDKKLRLHVGKMRPRSFLRRMRRHAKVKEAEPCR